MESEKMGLQERLDKGLVIGDGGFVFALEKRGYVKAGVWTPEVSVEHPEALRQLHREFLRAGADVMQTYTFYASDDKLENFGNDAKAKYTGTAINAEATRIAQEVAAEGGVLVAGGVSQTPSYLTGKSKEIVQEEFRKQVKVFVESKIDFIIAEYFEHVQEMEWAIEVCKEAHVPVVATMCINEEGDLHGVSIEDCALRMVDAGAIAVGINCHFGPYESIESMERIKAALTKAGKTSTHLMVQPLGFHTPEVGRQGFIELPEFPFALEPRIVTRWEVRNWARRMYDLGVRYIGGCCGFEPYHIRAIAEELASEHGGFPAGTEKHSEDASSLQQHTKPWVRARGRRDYWKNLVPSSGRPYGPALAKLDTWGVTQGDEDLVQKTDRLSESDYSDLVHKQEEHKGCVAHHKHS